ncbi:MAG: beta-propeller fold lactonase family protein [bacterium]|nr:beta-propeller fold lactonase family protein [bacterium]
MMLALTIAWATVCGQAEPADLPVYVGREVCQECHRRGHEGGICAVPDVDDHRQAFESLTTPEALEIAALSGLPDAPQQSLICLSCHATAAEEGARWTADTFRPADGVQCEACHGAGAAHADGYRGRAERGDDRAVPPLHQIDRWICGTCHRQLPSHQMVVEDGFRRARQDHAYKTPVNLAVSPDGERLFVVCQRADSLAIVNTATGRVHSEIPVGRRPDDVAVSPDGARLYVTNRLEDSVSVIDVANEEVVQTITVGDEPHGVLTAASGSRLFVLNTDENTISVLDAAARTEQYRLSAGRGPWSLAMAPDDRTVYATNVRPDLARFRDPHRSEITVLDAATGRVARRVAVPGANMLKGIDVVPAGPHRGVVLFVLMRSKNLVPATRLSQGWIITNGLGVLGTDGRVSQVLLDQPYGSFPDPNDVAVSPDGRYALVSSGGSDRVAVVDVHQLLQTIADATESDRRDVLPNHLGLSARFITKHVQVGANPRGATFSPDGQFAYVANALDDSVSVLETSGFAETGRIDLGGPKEITELRRGERLFHSAGITAARQFSCQSCHPDGHINGLTLDIEADGIGAKPVDNRTLRGIVDTAPFKWEGTNPSLFRQCGPRLAVFFTRIAPYTPAELQALVRYMCTIERPPNRYRPADGLTEAQYRGKLIFEREADNYGQPIPPAQRCVTCHSGPYKTAQTRSIVETTMWLDAPVHIPIDLDTVHDDKEFGPMGLFFFADTGVPAERLDAPHLNNIYDSAPYLHNGAAATLEEIWTRLNMLEKHGRASDLTRQQFNDLIAYLKAL